MQNSSKVEMNEVFELLARIKTVEPSPNLYSRTRSKMNRQHLISLFWVNAVACILLVCISAEIYVTLHTKKVPHEEVSSLIYVTNNILYHE